jgi:NhaP-type Na+/H+ or K+/H+ antiporter
VGGQWAQIAALALVALVVASADRVEGSGFIAAWVAGVAFGRVLRGRVPEVGVLSEELGSLLATLSFLGFGAMLLGPDMGGMGWRVIVYAIASLTLIRMVPVAIAMIRTGLSWPTVAYVGWFGPRGLASIVFGLLLADAALPHSEALVGAVYCTVALSVILHGCSAVVGAERYATWYEQAAAGNPVMPESRDVGQPEVRRRLLRGGPPNG